MTKKEFQDKIYESISNNNYMVKPDHPDARKAEVITPSFPSRPIVKFLSYDIENMVLHPLDDPDDLLLYAFSVETNDGSVVSGVFHLDRSKIPIDEVVRERKDYLVIQLMDIPQIQKLKKSGIKQITFSYIRYPSVGEAHILYDSSENPGLEIMMHAKI